MRVNPKTAAIIILLLLVFAFATAILRYPPTSKNFDEQMNDIRDSFRVSTERNQKMIDEMNQWMDSLQYFMDTKNIAGAEPMVRSLVRRHPNESYYWTLFAQLFAMKKQYDSAFYYYRFALLLDPKDANTFEKRAETYMELKKYPEAMNDYRSAYATGWWSEIEYAKVFELMKQKDSALKYYKISLERYPDSLYITDKETRETINWLQNKVNMLEKH